MIRRISIWGGPGSGKSTVTPWLVSKLKIADYNIEYINEHAKRWACQKRPIISFDQMVLTTQQINAEDDFLRSSVQYTITDAPVLIGYVYGKRNGLHYAPTLLRMGRDIERDYPSLNIFLIRDVPYKPAGRYETEKEADKAASLMLDFLQDEYGDVAKFPTTKQKDVLTFLTDVLS